LICPVTTNEGNCGGVVFTMKRRVYASMLALQCSNQCKKWCWKCTSVWEMNRTLRVTRNHPYIGEEGTNNFREMCRLIKEPLEATCTVQKEKALLCGGAHRNWSAHSRRSRLAQGVFIHVSSRDWLSSQTRTDTKHQLSFISD